MKIKMDLKKNNLSTQHFSVLWTDILSLEQKKHQRFLFNKVSTDHNDNVFLDRLFLLSEVGNFLITLFRSRGDL